MGGLVRLSRAPRRAGVAALVSLLVACASTPTGPEHVVKAGENLYRISRYYGVSVAEIRAANDIDDVRSLQIGQRLVIPDASKRPPSGALASRSQSKPRAARAVRSSQKAPARRITDLEFGWPVDGRMSSKFGDRHGNDHEGIDISARSGTPVRAAESGRVVHSGKGLGDYGKVVIVKHAGSYSTVYAHNRKNRVRKGEFVEKGQVIAEVGKTGNASGPHVHFEVRRDRRPQDPLLYLP
jgi:murein DD-endopeptidase MepM/ murein hydrolase activator NlpD